VIHPHAHAHHAHPDEHATPAVRRENRLLFAFALTALMLVAEAIGGVLSHSLALLARFKVRFPQIPTKSGLMVGLGDTRRRAERSLAAAMKARASPAHDNR